MMDSTVRTTLARMSPDHSAAVAGSSVISNPLFDPQGTHHATPLARTAARAAELERTGRTEGAARVAVYGVLPPSATPVV